MAAPALMLGGQAATGTAAAQNGHGSGGVAGKNIIMFITDQDRDIMHFPRDWAQKNLPGLMRLKNHGLTFENAFCNACMCSPSRASLLTGYFPAQHGVKYTLEEDMPEDQYPQVELPLDFKNIASVMSAAGYNVVYKGKWHLTKPINGNTFTPEDTERYGFARWNPPDGGANQDISQEGGGAYDHDGRYMDGQGDPAAGLEGVQQYLTSAAAQQQPFFMIVSLVNPHDVLLYPKNYLDGGYDDSWLEGDIDLPPTVAEDLSTKPSVQAQFVRLFQLSGRLTTREQKKAYINFYGNLMKASDAYLVDILNTLTRQDMLDDTVVIRTSDHGEMGLCHGGMRQKNYNFYEETLRVPLVYSNPQLWSRPATSQAMVSHVDFLPTLASLVNAPSSARADWQGVDYSDHILGRTSRPPQDYVVFTFDDFQAGQKAGPYVQPPQHIVSIREQRWKIAEYWDPNSDTPHQWEMYDLKRDPLERRNLAHPDYRRTPGEQKQYLRLRRKLSKVKAQRLQPLANTPQPITQGPQRRQAPAIA
ncbi:sulfatase-like hydrolase/transferase [Capillimicrobium parvum]|uniref:sulfatase-like hydrolase/transferase n=1 Tax=Capillimicrobium parvum TaxID=2884022 RepID=UPI00216AF2E5|nr:sulfatase-like hydrolase/transferase [Capillimicrobium parvum]